MHNLDPPDKMGRTLPLTTGIIIGAFSAATYNFLTGQSWTADKIGVISQMVVQFDAFLSAGATVGISVFWSSLSNTIRKAATRFQMVLIELDQLKPGSMTTDHQDTARKILKSETSFLPYVVLGIFFFVASAIVAVFGEMFSNIFCLGLSLDLLVAGTGLMFLSWYVFNFLEASLGQFMMEETRLLSEIRLRKLKGKHEENSIKKGEN